ncbi:hypothetical protein [Acidipila rosea]|uniref:Uncharacterized protein n=1 Tax=Acidipila rosea TaxID=768535 RepID=A0A4V2PUT7_9BACT|nr:hypothetical protein [Acidipila rosea]MBW4027475.1 hypothetical protein [Acidobacteriota bacterium]MBW4045654.1 hypothetical protein [Acidobacteriota bacterium]TCK71741.1 hypothetical protein C7378_3031 [Acidipila rosea]
MVNNCANPKCSKPLHYLREGRIFVFDVMDGRVAAGPDGKMKRRLEHYWLCGTCSQTMSLVQAGETGIQIIAKPVIQIRQGVTITTSALA